MEIFVWWFLLSIIAAAIASSKGRSGFGFFLLALLLSPLIGIVFALLASRNTARAEQIQIEDGEMRRCPQCAELVRREAIKCKHCASEITPLPPEQNRLTEIIGKITNRTPT